MRNRQVDDLAENCPNVSFDLLPAGRYRPFGTPRRGEMKESPPVVDDVDWQECKTPNDLYSGHFFVVRVW